MAKGTYTLILRIDPSITIEIGALGRRSFSEGNYLYIGSAFGPGGFKRIERHQNMADGAIETRHWHIDYLLADLHVQLQEVKQFPAERIECELAQTLLAKVEKAIPGFGCSDCSCESHLIGVPTETEREPLFH